MSTGRGTESGARFEGPTFRTSRRNFLAGISTLAGALAATTLAGKRAVAHDVGEACNQPGALQNNIHCQPGHPGFGGGGGGGEPCFLPGTRIAAPVGEVAIENLRIGDLVTCISGAAKPIKFIGRNRHTRAASEAWRTSLAPVRISRFALDGRTPHADLYLSPAHAVYLRGLLVPAKDLINGISITQEPFADALTLEYYHLDLEDHDVVFAEGAPAETYQGNNYWAFDNAEEYVALYGPPVGRKQPFAPVVSYCGGRQELKSRIRSVVAPLYDVRQPLDIIRDEIASRAELAWAA
jgi:hypothetical protein